MKITNVKYIRQDGYPLLQLEIDGVQTTISPEQKLTLIANGIVSCGSKMADKFSVVFRGNRFRGCTDDPELVEIVKSFGKSVYDGTFEPDDDQD